LRLPSVGSAGRWIWRRGTVRPDELPITGTELTSFSRWLSANGQPGGVVPLVVQIIVTAPGLPPWATILLGSRRVLAWPAAGMRLGEVLPGGGPLAVTVLGRCSQ
jgi:hypothetical protein